MREKAPLLLVVGPSIPLVEKALAVNGIQSDGGHLIRMVTRFTGLRGWTHGMPVLAADVSRWSELAGYDGAMLEETLMRMLTCGRLRLAQAADIEAFRMEMAG